ncbi:MAG: DegT/DnrJ/EryC1/StrS family aminotransferase [Rhizobiales bacterium]|nr:DegT/DnrJ/EryC1/StrS family aminotransferase [Hyphomicrobiales bacterium]
MNKISFIDLKTQYSVLEQNIKNSISNVLESGQFILGPIVEEAELLLSKYTEAKNTVTVSSGTDALFVSLLALDIGPGSKVFLPSFTYTATAEVIALLQATPVFVDVDELTYNISSIDLNLKINSYKKSELNNSAIIAVDLFGQPADYPILQKIADEHGLHLISDAAQSFGGAINDTKVGKLAPITTTSFYPTKPLSCYGDGGAIFTDDNDIAKKIKSIRSHGISNDPYENIRIGTNARFDAIQAAVIINKLSIFDEELTQRRKIASTYDQELSEYVLLPRIQTEMKSAWAHYTIRTKKRNAMRQFLLENDIPTMIYYPKPMHKQIAYQNYHNHKDTLPNSEMLCNEVLSLPLHPYINEDQILRITSKIKEFLKK